MFIPNTRMMVPIDFHIFRIGGSTSHWLVPLTKVGAFWGYTTSEWNESAWTNCFDRAKVGTKSTKPSGSIPRKCIYIHTLWQFNSLLLKTAIEIGDLPIENGGSFHSHVSLPEGIRLVYIVVVIPKISIQYPSRHTRGGHKSKGSCVP